MNCPFAPLGDMESENRHKGVRNERSLAKLPFDPRHTSEAVHSFHDCHGKSSYSSGSIQFSHSSSRNAAAPGGTIAFVWVKWCNGRTSERYASRSNVTVPH